MQNSDSHQLLLSMKIPAGASSSPWLVNVVKRDLPLLTGDGRTTSSADGTYETTHTGTSEEADLRRRAATLAAARRNAQSMPDAERPNRFPPRYPLFVTQLTNVVSRPPLERGLCRARPRRSTLRETRPGRIRSATGAARRRWSTRTRCATRPSSCSS